MDRKALRNHVKLIGLSSSLVELAAADDMVEIPLVETHILLRDLKRSKGIYWELLCEEP